MKVAEIQYLANGLDLRDFNLDFEAKADLDGGFECNIFSNDNHVVIVTGKGEDSKTDDNNKRMKYRHYSCQIGDDRYLKSVLESADIIKDQGLLTGEYGSMFISLISKVNSYGTRDTEEMNSLFQDYS
jgi:hypothetical protein